jgi:Zn-dependent M28 family amino/carboxypeptidase
MRKQQELITRHFTGLEAEMLWQPFPAVDPRSGATVQLANGMARWHEERSKRLLICCHYDTRPFPDLDPVNPQGVFIGANDGGSGVALLFELGHHIAKIDGKYGIDFVFFDGEEFVYVARRDPMFLGSTHFAQQYASGNISGKYAYAILVDMIGDKNLEIGYEGNSLKFAPRLTRSIWTVAAELGVTEFQPKQLHTVRDDHLPLNSIARIATCDIIDFDYPVKGNAYWHTEKDILENCSGESLEKVGRVLLEWLRRMQRP